MLPLPEALARLQQVANDVVAPSAEKTDRLGAWPEGNFRALQRAGLGGLVVPRAHGGLGLGLEGLARGCEILGMACPSTAISFGMHCVGSAVIASKPTPEQVERYLRPICEGHHLTTLAVSEPGTGSHFYIPRTELRVEDGGYALRGSKAFVTNGGHADSYVVSAVTAEPGSPPFQFSCLVVPADAGGMRWGPPWDGLGMRGNSSRTLALEEVRVPATDLLGKPGDQMWYIFNVIAPYFLTSMAGTYLGLASAALAEAREHLRSRSYAHSGRALAQEPVLQHRLGQLWAEVERARALLYQGARAADGNDPSAAPLLFSAKAEASEAAVRVVNEAMSLTGGSSYQHGSRLERLLRDARAGPVMTPTTDLLRTWTGRWLLELPLLGE